MSATNRPGHRLNQLPGHAHHDRAMVENLWVPVEHTYPADLPASHGEIARLVERATAERSAAVTMEGLYHEERRERAAERRAHAQALDELRHELAAARKALDDLQAKSDGRTQLFLQKLTPRPAQLPLDAATPPTLPPVAATRGGRR